MTDDSSYTYPLGRSKEDETKEERKIRLAKHAAKKRNTRKTTDTIRAEILDLSLKGLGAEEIGRVVGLKRSSVHDILKRFEPVFKTIGRVDDFRKVKPDILAAGQLQALEAAFSGDKLKKASFSSIISGFAELNKAERLETGQSTENIERKTFTSIEIKDLTIDSNIQAIDITED